MALQFASQQLPATAPEYVVWVDIMGIGPVMGRSIHMAANFIFKLHTAAVLAPAPGIRLYPVMDGLYASTQDQNALLAFLRSVFQQCAQTFIDTPQNEPLHRFMIRGALSYGPIIHGADVPSTAFRQAAAPDPFGTRPDYKNSIMLGLPMVQAHECEQLAPPFGLYVHESARSFAPPGQQPLHHVWWRWTGINDAVWNNLPAAVDAHLEWCAQRPRALQYAADRIETHRQMAREYFA